MSSRSLTAPADHAAAGGTLVLALGNPLRGDDGVGAAVLERLAQAGPPPGATLLDGGTPGLETVLLLQHCARAIIIDAASMGCAPGEWVRFRVDAVQMQPADPTLRGTLHSAGLAEALALGAALGTLPGAVVIYGVEPEAIGWEPGLSAPVAAAVRRCAPRSWTN
ncbi:MAG: hydrogenase maturation protease [Anaerolineae bacterium]|nr:hydrogenase maturation protease [Anaerolineae bacterium]